MEVIHKISEEGRKNGCPVGHRCDDCNWYRPTYHTKQDGTITQEFDCNVNNLVMLQSEGNTRVFGVQQSVESARNESVKRQDRLLSVVGEQHAALPSN